MWANTWCITERYKPISVEHRKKLKDLSTQLLTPFTFSPLFKTAEMLYDEPTNDSGESNDNTVCKVEWSTCAIIL